MIVFRQGAWTPDDFRCFLSALFSNKQRPYCILGDLVDEYFRETDFNQVNEFFDQCIHSMFFL
jgi:hypothetical protein